MGSHIGAALAEGLSSLRALSYLELRWVWS